MLDIKTLDKHLLGGAPTKFDEKKHIILLREIFFEGGSIARFCAEALIDKKTFYNWKKAHPKFEFAYGILINVAEVVWEKMPSETPVSEFNFKTWSLNMKNKFGFGNPRIDLETDEKTPVSRLERVVEAMGNGELGGDEIAKITHVIEVQADMENGNAAVKEIERRSEETREERLKLLSMYDKAIEDSNKPRKEEV